MDFQYSRKKTPALNRLIVLLIGSPDRKTAAPFFSTCSQVAWMTSLENKASKGIQLHQPSPTDAGSKFPQEPVRQCDCSLGLGGTAEIGIDISLHSSNWNETESSEKKPPSTWQSQWLGTKQERLWSLKVQRKKVKKKLLHKGDSSVVGLFDPIRS